MKSSYRKRVILLDCCGDFLRSVWDCFGELLRVLLDSCGDFSRSVLDCFGELLRDSFGLLWRLHEECFGLFWRVVEGFFWIVVETS